MIRLAAIKALYVIPEPPLKVNNLLNMVLETRLVIPLGRFLDIDLEANKQFTLTPSAQPNTKKNGATGKARA